MKLCAVQYRPAPGDIDANVTRHLHLARLVAAQADIVVFPELSLTGYEPRLAAALAVAHDDPRLEPLQELADVHAATLCAGAPLRTAAGVVIAMLVFRPGAARGVYAKQYLHADEQPFFVAGGDGVGLLGGSVAPAICYELAVPAHAAAAARRGAGTYLASVAKVARNIGPAVERLGDIAREHGMNVLMANAVGMADGEQCCGRSAAWNGQGERIAGLDDTREGLLLFDIETQQARAVYP